MDFFTVAGYAWKLVVAVPALGIGAAIGAFGYRYLLKKNPTMLNNLVALAEAELQKVASAAVSKAGAATTPTTVAAPVDVATAATIVSAVEAANTVETAPK